MKNNFLFFAFALLIISCQEQTKTTLPASSVDQSRQDAIIKKYLEEEASKYGLYSVERQEVLDRGLQEDSTIAYLWQQKAMPLFKQGKYELGMTYIDKAVTYNRARWQDYRAFIKCIFAKTYRAAIKDFEDCKRRVGNSYVMDHSYDFHIALSYLQLNEFTKAEAILKKDIETLSQQKGMNSIHHLDLFYYGISMYEQKKYQEAITIFDQALDQYSRFADVQYYKALSLYQLDQVEEAKALIAEASANGKAGYTINEDNAIYERYPYQMRWKN